MAKKPKKLENIKEVAERLAALRKSLFPSQVEFARKYGVAQPSVARWESGAAEPPLQVVIDLARLSHKSIDWILTGESDQVNESALVEKAMVDCPVVRHHAPGDKRQLEASAVVPLSMAWSILESETTTAQVLKLNVQEFYEKVYGPPGQVSGAGINAAAGANDNLKAPGGGEGRTPKNRQKAS